MPIVTDTLEFYHPTRDELLDENYLSWGEVALSSSEDRFFRLRNMSFAYSALDVTVSIEEMGIAEPARSVAAQHFLSLDGRRFTATIPVGGSGPRNITEVLIVRRVVAPDADLGFGDVQLRAHADDWR